MSEMPEARAVDMEARGMAREALAAVQAHDRLDVERWEQNERRWEEGRRVLSSLEERMMAQFSEVKVSINKLEVSIGAVNSTYANRFWALAIGLIATLLGVSGFLAVKVLF